MFRLNQETKHTALTFHSQLKLPENFDPLLNHFVYFQEPDKTKNIQSNEKSVTLSRKENTAHNNLHKLLPLQLYLPGVSYGAYFEEPDIHRENVVSHASTENISQTYKKRKRAYKKFDTKTNNVLSLDS